MNKSLVYPSPVPLGTLSRSRYPITFCVARATLPAAHQAQSPLVNKRMRTGVELTRSQKEKEQREESKADESPPPDAHPKELQRRPVLALALVSFAAVAATANQDTGTQ